MFASRVAATALSVDTPLSFLFALRNCYFNCTRSIYVYYHVSGPVVRRIEDEVLVFKVGPCPHRAIVAPLVGESTLAIVRRPLRWPKVPARNAAKIHIPPPLQSRWREGVRVQIIRYSECRVTGTETNIEWEVDSTISAVYESYTCQYNSKHSK